jgi:crossover junction endodeoxyribonuclease RuvC
VTESLDQRILGIDPGLNITGYAVVEKKGTAILICEAGVVRSTRGGSLESRLAEIFEGIREVIAGFKPASVAVEELYSHYERPRTAILMGHARGVICLAASLAGIGVQPYAATQVKRLLTGNGRAPKAQIQMAVCREFGLPEVPQPPDVADALAIAVCHLHLTNTTLNLT